MNSLYHIMLFYIVLYCTKLKYCIIILTLNEVHPILKTKGGGGDPYSLHTLRFAQEV